MSLQVVLARARDREFSRAGARRCAGTSMRAGPSRYCAGEARLCCERAARAAPKDRPCPPRSRRRARSRRRGRPRGSVSSSCSTTMTVLPRSRRRRERLDEARVVARCRPMLGSSSTYITPDSSLPSWLARRMRCASPPLERRPGASEREVVEPDVEQEREPALGSRAARPRRSARRDGGQRRARRSAPTPRPPSSRSPPRCSCPNAKTAQALARRRLPPHASHGLLAHEAPVLLARCLRRGLAEAPHRASGITPSYAWPRCRWLSAPLLAPRHGDLLAVERRRGQLACLALGSLLHGHVEVDLEGPRDAVDDARTSTPRRAPSRWPRARSRRSRIDSDGSGTTSSGRPPRAVPRPLHARAHAERRVEREALRARAREARCRSRRAPRCTRRSPAAVGALDASSPLPSRRPSSTPSAMRARSAGAHDEAVDDEVDDVLLLLVERGHGVERVRARRRRARARSRARGARRRAPELALAVHDERRQDRRASCPRAARGSRASRPAAPCAATFLPQVGQCCSPTLGVEDAQVVVDLGDGADGRARVGRGALLLDGDGRREAAQVVDLGALELAEELARVGAQRLDVAALALGVERVEREARLARARSAR